MGVMGASCLGVVDAADSLVKKKRKEKKQGNVITLCRLGKVKSFGNLVVNRLVYYSQVFVACNMEHCYHSWMVHYLNPYSGRLF